ncbi:hypothetical protein [Actinosynnema mirum]|nr:hypothetical protein [Actinosynnema mirum]
MSEPKENPDVVSMSWAARRDASALPLLVIGTLLAVTAAVRSQWLLDVDGWAALGQWVGGLGAFAAVAAALWIASRDRRAADLRDQEAARSHAFLVVATCTDQGVLVVNHGPEPVTRLVVPKLHSQQVGELIVDDMQIAVRQKDMLLPGESWIAPYPRPDEREWRQEVKTHMIRVMDDDPDAVRAEVHWSDLGGRHWVRVGSLDPRGANASDWRPTAETD